MAVDDGPMVRAPVVHHAVNVLERTFRGIQARGEPGRGPALVGAVVEDFELFFRNINCPSFRELEYGTQVLDDVHADHRAGHATLGQELGGEASTTEVFTVRGHPDGGIQAGIGLLRGDLPEGFHGGFTVAEAAAAAVQRGGA